MHFQIDGDRRGDWREDRDDLPLYPGDTVTLDGHPFEIIDGPNFEADWQSATIGARFIAKPAPTNF